MLLLLLYKKRVREMKSSRTLLKTNTINTYPHTAHSAFTEEDILVNKFIKSHCYH